MISNVNRTTKKLWIELEDGEEEEEEAVEVEATAEKAMNGNGNSRTSLELCLGSGRVICSTLNNFFVECC